jgi:hypothetical protein
LEAELEAKRERLALMEQKIKLQEGLPFLYGWKWYTWARAFFESTNKLNFLCAANQISKSSTQIRKCMHWATAPELWPQLWATKPVQFWYLYPTANQATIEFKTKWQQFLPRGEFKEHPVYGWKAEIKNKEIFAIYFNSGVSVFFKSYAQDTQALQTGTCDAIFCDEELPLEHYEELLFRLSASDGYFHMVFTATLGQEFWRLVMEAGEKEVEKLPEAFKQTISMFECMFYEDGTPSHWTKEKIQMVINRCSTHNEVLKRVYGRFLIDDTGKKYPQFNVKKNMAPEMKIPSDWFIYAGADYGSGGERGHKSALCFVAVRPDFQRGYAFLGWRGDGVETTAGDVVDKLREMKRTYKIECAAQYYDHGCKDMEIIATRMGEPLEKADKAHDKGEQVMNTLFKYNILSVFENEEFQKLATEMSTLRKDTPKNKAKDDFVDALRYAVTQIPWDWTVIDSGVNESLQAPAPEKTPTQLELEDRRKAFEDEGNEQARIDAEFAEWNDAYG